MFELKHVIITSLLISHLGLTSHASRKKDDQEVYNLIGKKGTLNESLLPDLEKVKELKINNCHFQDISTEAFKFMTSLKKVMIKDSEIGKLPEGLFQTCPKLKEIEIKRTKIHNLEEGSFVNLTKLEEVEIEDSNIKLEDDMFLGCEKLEELSYNQCEAPTLNLDAFNGINLHELELKNNKIQEFSFHNFPKMTNLKVISLSGNPLTSFDVTEIREKCPNLRKIKLKKTDLPLDTVKQLKSMNIRVKTGD